MASFLKELADDLLHLEINTIVKSQMSAAKMPRSSREALYELASRYSKALEEIGSHRRYDDLNATRFGNGFRGEVRWAYGGVKSFGELRQRAEQAVAEIKQRLEQGTLKQLDGQTVLSSHEEVAKDIKSLERVRINAHRIVGIFKRRESELKSRNGAPSPIDDDLFASSHDASAAWNNDVDRDYVNRAPDLELDTQDVLLIHKAWDVGTEEIVMQSIIGLDGDVTTRILKSFAKDPDQLILQIHGEAVSASIGYWDRLVQAVSKIGELIKR